jgi:hypothetical protein
VRLALPWLLLVAFTTHVGAHVAIVVALARRREWRRAVAALLIPPLAPFWAWHAKMRALAYAWVAALAFFALGVAAAG